ncbi:MAG: hypothetical protein U0946_07780 [Patescibacteria group bacterium]|nr:hypothetical protein [Patescibacteria group bacterium]
MVDILSIDQAVQTQVKRHNLSRKFIKACFLLTQNIAHPSLRVELLKPKQDGIYSFRLDRKYRCLFVYRHDRQMIEILNITVHYQ